MTNDPQKEVRVMKASRMLQAKAGTGAIDEKKLQKSQSVIDGYKADFVPIGKDLIGKLELAVKNATAAIPQPVDHKNALHGISEILMQIKGNAGMFQYPLLSRLAATMLDFFEAVSEVNQDLIDLANANIKTLRLILDGGLTGDGGAHGTLLEKELKSAGDRYFAKHGIALSSAKNAEEFLD
ncbi:MAG: hypothetical protein HY370_09755 [Proteobacteria bacterium]|nr:hypothetical protein [Pseudomonadota bacterium]